MSDQVRLTRQMPLDGHLMSHAGLTVRPVQNLGKIILQRSNSVTDGEMAALGQKLTAAFDLILPLQVGCRATCNDISTTVFHIDPNSWMILCDGQDVLTIIDYIGSAAGNTTIIASEMTDQYVGLDIEGLQARSLLAKGCALDLAAEVFSEAQVACTLLAQADIMLYYRGDDSFRVIIDVSLCDYLWYWLEGAAAEFTT